MRYGTAALAAVAAMMAAGLAQAARGLPDFTKLVEEASPAVVNISTTQKVERRRRLPPGFKIPDMPEGTPFGDLFRHFFGEQGETEEVPTQSLGSGFFISPDGYLLTNAHVVKGADEIVVRLSDRRELQAKVVGLDERSDVALLKVEVDEPVPAVRIGDSRRLKVGEWVLAIGSPFGFDHSVTAGIVSAKGRSLPRESYVPFIQTDVAINPGNSGGPLFNMDGEVVGINSQIYSRTGGFMGLSFAIPIDVAMDVAEQLKATGKVTRGWLGVLIQDVNRELAESFGLDKPTGAVVARVLPDSPAAKAGIQVGDVILEYDGREVPDSAALPPMVGRTRVGREVPVTVLREGKRITLRVRIGELPAEEELARAAGEQPDKARSERLGIVVGEVPDEIREALDLPEGGVVVEEVGDGAGRAAGLEPGDVIVRVGGEPVEGVEQFRKLIKELPAGKAVALLVQRRSGPLFLALKVPADE
nr:DegQ family serine endoprotease [Inmirania thermothiophila]